MPAQVNNDVVEAIALKLLDGKKAYLHAIIDNYSRKILAWTVAERLDPSALAAKPLSASSP
jgi:putative transposase